MSVEDLERAEKDLDKQVKESIATNSPRAPRRRRRSRTRPPPLRNYYNFLGLRRMEDEAAELEHIEDQKKAWREYYNWLGERRMEDEDRTQSFRERFSSAIDLGALMEPFKAAVPEFRPVGRDAGGDVRERLRGRPQQHRLDARARLRGRRRLDGRDQVDRRADRPGALRERRGLDEEEPGQRRGRRRRGAASAGFCGLVVGLAAQDSRRWCRRTSTGAARPRGPALEAELLASTARSKSSARRSNGWGSTTRSFLAAPARARWTT